METETEKEDEVHDEESYASFMAGVGTFLGYGLMIAVMTVLLFVVPYVLFKLV